MFEKRSYERELMDDLTLGGEEMAQTLRELKFINRWLGGNAVTTRGLNRLLGKRVTPSTSLTIADLGCGGGDMLVLMAQWARQRNLPVRLVGIDANEYIIDYARRNTANYPEISYLHADIFSPSFQAHTFDIVTCTLFCHHFTDEQLIALFRQLRTQARMGVVVNDLHRHWLAYHSIKWLTAWFSRSPLVKNDAKLSVRRAFRKRELAAIFREANILHCQIHWKWAFRWQVVSQSQGISP